MGFVSRTDVIGTTPGINWYYRGKTLPFKKILRSFEPGFIPEFYWQASTGKVIEKTLYFWPIWLNFQSGAYLGYGIYPSYQNLTQSFTPLDITISPGHYSFWQNDIFYSSDPSKFISAGGEYKWGGYFNGRLVFADWKVQIAPIPHISILAEFDRNHFMKVGENKTSETVDLYIIQGRLALNPRIQLTGFYQKNSLDHSDSYYIRFSWEYQPLSYIYLIFNHAGSYNIQQLKQMEDHEIFKVSYLKQF